MVAHRSHRLAKRPGTPHRTHLAPVLISACIAVAAIIAIGYILWPTWNSGHGQRPDRLPVTVGGTLFNVPTHAIRMKVQQHPGAQERVDIALTYPALAPPPPTPHVTAATVDEVSITVDRLFITLAAHNGALAPDERVQSIYPRYLEPQPSTVTDGLTATAFRDGTPYRNEDLLTATSPVFVARCSRDAATPGICLAERRIGGADITFRFPRAWLSDWRTLAANLDRALALFGITN